MPQHTVSSFDSDLHHLTTQIADMGGQVEKQINDAIESLVRRDLARAREVIAADNQIDVMQRIIEEKAILTIARRQPMAVDLRQTVAAIRISNDLERMGDLAKNIAKRVIAIQGAVPLPSLSGGFDAMARLTIQRVKQVLDAYLNDDLESSRHVWLHDGDIDALNNSLFRELLTYMMEDPRNISSSTHLLFCAKNLERIGDLATNIAETVHYIITGEHLADERPKNDTTSSTTL